MTDLNWTPEDAKAVDTARILAADAVQQAGSGHPGSAISLAAVAYLLYQKVMYTDPSDPHWLGRDRFVLSAGHESVLLYVALYMAGCGLTLSDLQNLRTWGSKTPGHPEYGHTPFVEVTTGPLGAGISNAVGMAMAARRQRGLFEPDAAPGASLFDHFVFALSGDGCLQEGVALEAISLAGTQELANLILIYDDNNITIEGDTGIAFTEDVLAKFAACGWHTQEVDWRENGAYHEDMSALYNAIRTAQAVTNQPSVIKLNTIIGWPLPNKQGSESIHGAAIGAQEISALKALLGFNDTPFAIDETLINELQVSFAARAGLTRQAWDSRFNAWREDNPAAASLLWRVSTRALPMNLSVPNFEPGKMSTRKASAQVLDALAPQLPELWGGSADLAGSNLTTMTGEPSFLPSSRVNAQWPGDCYGRTLHFGIREHAMGGIMNGMAAEGLTRPYGGTFFVFSDYMRPAVRLAALMKLPVIYVWTHDSIGVGEDGPTHQPIEHLASYRAIPGLSVIRPADANETAVCWKQALIRCDGPNALVLSRQDLRTVDRRAGEFAAAELAAKGGYILRDAQNGASPQVILLATGSEVEIALDAQTMLETAGVPTRMVSLPCFRWFEEQSDDYKAAVLPPEVKVRVSVEAGISLGWQRYVGDSGKSISIEHFGASAAAGKLYQEFGITADAVVAAVKAQL
ncbi:MAG: transketolase [Propionibacteriaceae bacterium]|jgi:transketolase|nr:transketolase [Propionibacteriaceae bacterium]